MEIKPPRLIKNVSHSGVDADDLLHKPGPKFQKTSLGQSAFSFHNDKLVMNGKDVGQLIAECVQKNPQMPSQLAGEIEEFKRLNLKRRKKKTTQGRDDDEISKIFALCDAYLMRISELIKKQYDQTKDGVSVFFDEDGQLSLNGMNVHALVEKCRDDPNPKALLFLKGVRNRLNHILENRSNNANFERLQLVILKLMDEIGKILNSNK
jgi:hypothetical protein